MLLVENEGIVENNKVNGIGHKNRFKRSIGRVVISCGTRFFKYLMDGK
jgi:hypothetical protein